MMFSIRLKLILLDVIAELWLEFKTATITAIEDKRINTSYWLNQQLLSIYVHLCQVNSIKCNVI